MWYVIACHPCIEDKYQEAFATQEEADRWATYMNSVDSELDYRVYFEEM